MAIDNATDNASVDAKVLDAIGAGASTFNRILCVVNEHAGDGDFRVVDRSLQRLRRAERITYDRKKGWSLA